MSEGAGGYFDVFPAGQHFTPAQVRAIHAEIEREGQEAEGRRLGPCRRGARHHARRGLVGR